VFSSPDSELPSLRESGTRRGKKYFQVPPRVCWVFFFLVSLSPKEGVLPSHCVKLS